MMCDMTETFEVLRRGQSLCFQKKNMATNLELPTSGLNKAKSGGHRESRAIFLAGV